MQFLVLSERDTAGFTADQFDEIIPAETEHVRQLYADGIVRQIWLRGDTLGASFVLEVDSAAQADRVIALFPLAQRGMSSFQIIPLTPYRGFGPR